ncbi:hypothetical protein ACTFIV_009077 [Dictyostelium citrinum]
MDNLFRLVFNNKVIRIKIFKEISEINKRKYVKRYNQCGINWIIRNNHFQLMLYKFKKHNKTREQFTDDLFFLFLEKNIDLEIFKEILQLFPQYQPISFKYSSKIIELCCLNNSFKDSNHAKKLQFIEYIIDELNITPTLTAINYLCANGNDLPIIKILIEKGYYSIENQSDIGLLLCTLKEKDFQLYDNILKFNKELKNRFQSYFDPTNILLTKSNDIRFYHSLFGNNDGSPDKNVIVESGYRYYYNQKMYQLTSHAILYSNLDILKYLCKNKPIDYNNIICIATKNDKVDGGLSSIDLLKFFFGINDLEYKNKENSTFSIEKINNLFKELCQNGKLECLQYLIQRFKKDIIIDNEIIDITLELNNLEILDWILKIISEKDIIKYGICSSSTGLESIIHTTLFNLKDKLLFQYYIDLILKPINRNLIL